MKLARASGMAHLPELTDEQNSLLVETALNFYRAGGVLTLSDFADLEDQERIAMMVAFEHIQAERAVEIGLASSGYDGCAEVLGRIDGGETKAKIKVETAARRAANGLQRIEIKT